MKLVCAVTFLQLADDGTGTSIWPCNRIVKWLARRLVPNNGGFTLVRYANGSDIRLLVAKREEFVGGFVDACCDGLDDFLGILLVPTAMGIRRSAIAWLIEGMPWIHVELTHLP